MFDTDINAETSDFYNIDEGLTDFSNSSTDGNGSPSAFEFPKLSEIDNLSSYITSTFLENGDLKNGDRKDIETVYGQINVEGDISEVNNENDITGIKSSNSRGKGGGNGQFRFFDDSLISASLTNDTVLDGGTNTDTITSDISIDGKINRDGGRTLLFAGLDGQNFRDFVNISKSLDADGNFSLDRGQVEEIGGGAIADGEHDFQLLAVNINRQGIQTDFDVVDFELNRVLYTISSEDTRELALVNTETNDLVKVKLDDIEGWQNVETELRSTAPRYFEGELTPEQVYIPDGEPSPIGSGASGTVSLVLDPTGSMFDKQGPAVQYKIQLSGVDLGGTSTETTADDVTAIHFHSGERGEERIGTHTLNVFGMPGEDDDDAVFDFENNTITGIWDNADSLNSANNINTSNGIPDHHLSDVLAGIDPLSTKTVSEYADELLANSTYLQVHTNEFPIPGGVVRSQIEEVSRGDENSSTEGFIEPTFVEHTLVTPDEKRVYLTVNGSLQIANAVVGVDVNSIDWDAGTADLSVRSNLITAEAGEPTRYPSVGQVDETQPIQSWTALPWNQTHGPSVQPGSSTIQFSQLTNNRLFLIDDSTGEPLEGYNPLVIDGVTDQLHGAFYNPSGTIALTPGYYWDRSDIGLFNVDRQTDGLVFEDSIDLNSKEGKGAYNHFVTWIDDRYAYAASMQYGPTSLTPEGEEIAGPSIWLIDAVEQTAQRVVGTADTADDPGVFRNPSDFVVVGDKLYVAEEDSLDASFGDDGYVAVYDISSIDEPKFIKRLKPGQGLPSDFEIAHGLSATPDGSAVYVASYRSDYLLKIDTATDTVVKTYGAEDGLSATHGGFAAGSLR